MSIINVTENSTAINLAALEAGAGPEPEPEPCPRCGGTGVIELPTRYGAWVISDTAACPQCTPQTEDESPF